MDKRKVDNREVEKREVVYILLEWSCWEHVPDVVYRESFVSMDGNCNALRKR